MNLRGWSGLAGVLVILLVSITPASALAAATRTAAAAQPQRVCSISDERLAELSGLAVGPKHWYAVNDGGKRVEVFVLGDDCTVRDVITNATDPYDVEDMARAADGTLWLGDTGDNSARRSTVALHAVRPDGSATLYRLTYPDGKHDAEALVLGDGGTPYIVTKTVLGTSGVYRPAKDLVSPGPTPLEKIGSVDLPMTDTTGGPAGAAGSTMITAAAFNQDRTVLAVRSYTDAYLYPAGSGGVVAALQREPVRIALPGERQGEALSFRPDGTLLSAGEGVGEPVRAVSGAAAMVDQPDQGDTAGNPAAGNTAGDGSGQDGGLPTVPAVTVAVILGGAVVFGLSRMRRGR